MFNFLEVFGVVNVTSGLCHGSWPLMIIGVVVFLVGLYRQVSTERG